MFVNCAILILAAATFFRHHQEVTDLQQAYLLLTPLLGTLRPPELFAIALFASGQSSTLTGTLAGQIVMEGFLNIRVRPWLRRLVTRALAIMPAFVVIWLAGRRRRRPASHPEPGGAEHATSLRHHSADPLHQRSGPHGRVREQALGQS